MPQNSLDVATSLVLTNAIYFKASWLTKFDPDQTADGTFHAASGVRTVPMMHKTFETSYAEGDGYQAVALPYLSKDVRMLILLPAEGQFEKIAGSLNDTFYQELLSNLSGTTVKLTMPRFSFESENPLKSPLQSLGMTVPFSDTADFSGISGKRDLFIDEVYHKAFVAVDEKGTEAAAATAVVMTKSSAPLKVPEVTLDRPFVFTIYDHPTGEILFLGHLADPNP